MSTVVSGPLWAARNWSIDAGAGSIHDDQTATDLGFRGGTVAGDVHMNQFPPVLHRVFGDAWFERGHLSLSFKNPTVDLERVQVFAEPLASGAAQTRVWMEREDGLLVNEGTAGVGDTSNTALRSKDWRGCDPSELRILRQVEPGMSLGQHVLQASPERQFERYDRNQISDPLAWFREDSPWGGVIAAPCTIIQYLWGPPQKVLDQYVADGVGLFGSIEISFTHGPMLLGREYRVESEVLAVGQSPKTEFVWYESHAYNDSDQRVATMLMQGRMLKAASALYEDEA